MAGKAQKPGNGGKTREREEKRGAVRASFDQAAALEALIWAKGGEQLALPGLPVARFAGVVALPDDAGPREAGRPPGARNLVPQAYREYLVATYGSAVEGLAQDATRPVLSIVAELAQAYVVANAAFGRAEAQPTAAQIGEWVQFAKSLQLQARRYVAPYQHTQAPQPQAQAPSVTRIGVAMFTGGKPSPEQARAAGASLAGLLGIEQNQQVSDTEPLELNAEELNAEEPDHG